MNLSKKKELASKVLRVGRKRIHFVSDKLQEIKEAITKQDIRDLYKEGYIVIKEIKGRKKIKKRKTKRGPGKIKKKVNKRKQKYVKLTRKLRKYLKELKNQGKIEKELYWKIRKKIKMSEFKNKASLKDYLEQIEKIDLRPVERGEAKKAKDKKKTSKKPETKKTIKKKK